ncbi:MAG: DUF86 domain-containing protein [Deltaproteobacteria bacterium]|nr:DUF86 domain-containing protein [Deltaproteobacteria bacterium]
MSPLEGEVIRRKLVVMVEDLIALEPIRDMTKDEYVSDLYKRKATERLLQEIIEAAIDINTHIIVQSGRAVPDDYYESFLRAGELNVISKDLAEKLAPSAGLRNRLVHEYDLLEHSLVLDAVRIAEELYPRYVKEIEDYISRKSL